MTESIDLETYLLPYPQHVQNLMLEGRLFLLERYRPVIEMHYDATSAVCAAVSYTGDLNGVFVNLAAYFEHVTLVFNWGVKLEDPHSRLKGEGKQVRHIRLVDFTTLVDPYVLGLMDQASDNAPRPEGEIIERIITKVYEGPKRRPGI